jgi:hypothetical protein
VVVLAVGVAIAAGPRLGGAPDADFGVAHNEFYGAPTPAMADPGAPLIEVPPPVIRAAAPAPPADAAPVAPVVRVEKAARRTPPAPRRTETIVLASAPAATPSRERQQQDYEQALARYQENERAAGYQWASDNRVSRSRYCKSAAQRTPAFLQGCMTFVRAGGGRVGSDRADPEA